MDFLDHVFFDNTVRNYLLVAGIILLVLLVKRFLSRYIISLFYRLAKRIWLNLDKKSFLELIAVPMEWFLLVVIAIFSIDKLNFPEVLTFELYGHSTKDIF